MILTEKHQIKFNAEMDDLTFQVKNIYNSALYEVRQHFFEHEKYLGFFDLYHVMTKTDAWKDSPLPVRVRTHAIRLLDQNFKSFFKALKSYRKNPKRFKAVPRIPKYKDSTEGRVVAIYEKGAISKKQFKKGYIVPSGTNIRIKSQITDWNSIKQVRIVPKINHFVVEVLYEREAKPLREDANNFASIDLGLNNLATMVYSDGTTPMIFNGKPLKSINQFYNKKKGDLQSKLTGNRKSSNAIQRLTHKRNNKVTDFLHKSSRLLVNQLVSKGVDCLVIGNNVGWKQDINIGKRNNQNFVQIPHSRFIEMLEYKCLLEGINVIRTEESYTSKCSFLDLEKIGKHETYKGKRVKRGMFKASCGRMINADVNGAYNIMRKVVPEVFAEGIEGVAVHPEKMSLTLS